MDPELISASTTKKQSVVEYLPKIGNYLLGISIICYISGFVITNLYLGSLGIVNLEILRSRYILSGFLFLTFLATIAYLIYGLIKTLDKYREKSVINILFRVLLHSIDNFIILFFVLPVFIILAGSISAPPIGIPNLTPITPWGDWFKTVPAVTLLKTFEITGVLASVAISLLIIIVLINPVLKDGIKRSRIQLSRELLKILLKDKLNVIGFFILAFILIYLAVLMNSALLFLSSNKVVKLLEPIKTSSGTIPTLVGWGRFFFLIVIIYIIATIFIIPTFLRPSSSPSTIDNPLSTSHGLIILIAIAIILILPAYTLGVYPNIPQQVGGGQIIRVDPFISDDNISVKFLDPNVNTYLIDRTASSSIFMLVNKAIQENKILEIQNDLILSITYNP